MTKLKSKSWLKMSTRWLLFETRNIQISLNFGTSRFQKHFYNCYKLYLGCLQTLRRTFLLLLRRRRWQQFGAFGRNSQFCRSENTNFIDFLIFLKHFKKFCTFRKFHFFSFKYSDQFRRAGEIKFSRKSGVNHFSAILFELF